ncbi:helix-turn-helix domain-containing protein [Arthrobacter sp. RCC_34]|uniref:helix-turn-helix domain-containing protein n=1 Tax=Arthrobacter sp. RCC_34 TaxID=3239230 RepID=UPI00352446D5
MNSRESGEVQRPATRFLTLEDLQAELQITYTQALSLVRSGDLPAIQIGGRGIWRVERVKLEEYIEAAYRKAARQRENEADWKEVRAWQMQD